jgi:hypothetical protein
MSCSRPTVEALCQLYANNRPRPVVPSAEFLECILAESALLRCGLQHPEHDAASLQVRPTRPPPPGFLQLGLLPSYNWLQRPEHDAASLQAHVLPSYHIVRFPPPSSSYGVVSSAWLPAEHEDEE